MANQSTKSEHPARPAQSIDEFVDKLIDQVGGCGSFYIWAYAAIGMGTNCTIYFLLAIPFFI